MITGISIIAGSLYMIFVQIGYVTTSGSDFYLYYTASERLLQGTSIYDHEYAQFPFMTLVTAPLILLPYETSAVIWDILIIICYLVMGFVLYKEFKLHLPLEWLVVIAGIYLIWFPFLENISLGQISIPLSLLIVLAWSRLRNNNELTGGIFLGLAALIKLYPGLFLLYLLLMRKFKAAAAMCITGMIGVIITFLVVGDANFIEYFTSTLPNDSTIFAGIPLNLSLYGVTIRAFSSTEWMISMFNIDFNRVFLMFGVTTLVIGLYVLHTVGQRKKNANDDDRLFAITILSMLLISPITWPHVFPMLLIPFSLVFREFLKTKNLWLFRILLFEAMIFSLPYIKIASSIFAALQIRPIHWAWGFIFLLPTVGFMILWLLLLIRFPYASMKAST